MTSDSRDYFRRGPSQYRFEGWAGTPVTWTLVFVHAVLFLVYAGTVNRLSPGGTLHEVFRDHLSLSTTNVVSRGRVWQVATYFWLHGPRDILGAVYTLAFLFFFGRPLERVLGRGRYLRLYLAGGIVTGCLALPWLSIVSWPEWPVATPAGAVYAVSIGYLLRAPHEVTIFGLPGWGFALFLVGFHLAMAAVIPMGEVDSFFPIAGAGFAWLHLRGSDRLAALFERSRARREARVRDAETGRRAADRRRVDDLLDKISREGIGSLSEEERRFLQDRSGTFPLSE